MTLEPVSDGVFVPLLPHPFVGVCWGAGVCVHTHMLLLHTGTQDPAATVVIRGLESRRPQILLMI